MCRVQLDAVDSSGLVMPVSVWSYVLHGGTSEDNCQSSAASATADADAAAAGATGQRRRVLVLEPVNSVTAHVSFDSHVSSLAAFSYSTPGNGAKYCDEHVCLCV